MSTPRIRRAVRGSVKTHGRPVTVCRLASKLWVSERHISRDWNWCRCVAWNSRCDDFCLRIPVLRAGCERNVRVYRILDIPKCILVVCMTLCLFEGKGECRDEVAT